ncbi:thioredoxin family protein [Phragmitibacter flavus]|nr:thioredoxin family protein [Phragmitibacter flavus]
MKSILKFSILSLFAAASLAVAADFPKGSPKFNDKLDAALAEAKTSNKPVIAVFSAVWCPPCQMMKKDVYPSEEIKAYQDKFVWVYIDTDIESNAKDAAKYKVSGIPHIQFISADGKSLDSQIGASSASEFAKTLDGVLKKAG